MQRQELVHYLADLLQIHNFKDFGYNGLQVSGKDEINCIASSPTASLQICTEAVAAGADALLVHHGIIWGGVNRVDGMLRDRLACLLGADCNLLAYHLPLDANAEWGNNHFALEALGISDEGSFGNYKGSDIGRWGKLDEPISAQDLAQRCEQAFKHPVVHCPGADKPIERVGVITGGGQNNLLDAHAAGLDAFITGEASEQTWHEAHESTCHCFACGHYATENIAVHKLAEHLCQHFGLQHIRLEQANPI